MLPAIATGDDAYIRQCGIEAVLMKMANLRVSQINGRAYCIDLHNRDLMKNDIAREKLALAQIWHEAGSLFEDRERAALRWAETVMLVAETHISDEEFQAARAVFTEKEVVDLTLAIGLMNAYNRMAVGGGPGHNAGARA